MGSRPSSHGRPGDRSNGSVGTETEQELRAQNTQLEAKLAELENLQTEGVRLENTKLRNENEKLRQRLAAAGRSLSADGIVRVKGEQSSNSNLPDLHTHDSKSMSDFPPNYSGDDRSNEGSAALTQPTDDLMINNNNNDSFTKTKTLSPPITERRQKKKTPKINPNSIPRMMSDIDAYGQGLPLPDDEKLRKNIRISRTSQRKNDSDGNSTKNVSLSPIRSPYDDQNSSNVSSADTTDQEDVHLGAKSSNQGGDNLFYKKNEENSYGFETNEDLLM